MPTHASMTIKAVLEFIRPLTNAERSFHALGNQVLIAGRPRQALDETTAANPGMKLLTVDMQDPASIRAFAARAIAEFPSLNVLINNAGIMRAEKLLAQQPDLADAEAIVTTNLLGP